MDDPNKMERFSPQGATESGPSYYPQPTNQQSHPTQQVALSDQDRGLQLLAQQSSRAIAPNLEAHPSGIPEARRESNPYQYHEHTQPPQHAPQLQNIPQQMNLVSSYEASSDMSHRKRQKVSRACDECRRKKVRCDATEEAEGRNLICSNCKRSGSGCMFTRAPMKRGPSKGYIKELADRLGTLEAQGQGQAGLQQQFYPNDIARQQRNSADISPPEENMPRKRAFSGVSGDLGPPYHPQRPSVGWASQDLPSYSHHPQARTTNAPPTSSIAPTMFQEHHSPNGLEPAVQWRTPPEPVQSSSHKGALPADYYSDRVTDYDEAIVDGYYNLIHPTYPILALNKHALTSMVSKCTVSLREAFYEALHAAVWSLSKPNPTSDQQSSRKAAQLITASYFENTGDMITNLVQLQVIILMSIEASNRDPSRAHIGLPQAVLLGSAVGLAYSLKLYAQNSFGRHSDNDPDSTERIGTRIWWSLVIMERWHAASTSCPLQIPDESVVISHDDKALLDENVYELARLSSILGHFQLIPTDISDLTTPSVPFFATLARGELGRWRESLPSSTSSPEAPIIYLCYRSLQILLAIRLPDSEPQDILGPSLHIINILKSNDHLVSPLLQHAIAIAAVALIGCTKFEQTRQEASTGLTTLLEIRLAPTGWDTSIREMILKSKNPSQASEGGAATGNKPGTTQQIAQGSLNQLAELAVEKAENSTSEGRKEVSAGGNPPQRFQELREVIRNGYLSKLSGKADR